MNKLSTLILNISWQNLPALKITVDICYQLYVVNPHKDSKPIVAELREDSKPNVHELLKDSKRVSSERIQFRASEFLACHEAWS